MGVEQHLTASGIFSKEKLNFVLVFKLCLLVGYLAILISVQLFYPSDLFWTWKISLGDFYVILE